MSILKMKSLEIDRKNDFSIHRVFEEIRSMGMEAVLLESGDGTGQWSFIGIVNCELHVPPGEKGLLFIRDFLKKNGRPKNPSDPPFTAGFVGFINYDLGVKWMEIDAGSEIRDSNDSGLLDHARSRRSRHGSVKYPEAYFVYVEPVVAFKRGDCLAVHLMLPARNDNQTIHLPFSAKSNITRAEYFEKIAKIKEYLYAGETYQVNFSQCFEEIYKSDPFELYKKVTSINPSPFQFFLETPDFAVISNSPERLFHIHNSDQDRVIETRPIKGTVPRGRTPEEDEQNIQKLLASPKEAAELAMIVDLERNDLGKICKPGTVEVNENRLVEKYSHVIHTVSNIRGLIEEKYDWYDALHALFPGGSVTGCPKKRTMEIIAALEGAQRGVYCGSAGYIDLSGDCDFNIMIRTIWFDKNKQNAIMRFGGGIVADSEPEKEYEETLHKAQAIINSLFQHY